MANRDFYKSIVDMRKSNQGLNYPQINTIDDNTSVGNEISAYANSSIIRPQTDFFVQAAQEKANAPRQESVDNPNFYQQVFGFIDETEKKLFTGAVKGVEGILDFGANILGWFTDVFGGDGSIFTDWAAQDIASAMGEFKKNYLDPFTNPRKAIENAVKGNWTNQQYWNDLASGYVDIMDTTLGGAFGGGGRLDKNYKDDSRKYSLTNTEMDDGVAGFIGNLAMSAGEMLPSILVGNYVGGLSSVAALGDAGAKIAQGAGLATFGLAAAGNSSEEALQQGASSGQALGYGIAKGGVEVASEIVVGKALNGIAKVTGLDKTLGKFGNNINGYKFGSELFKNTTKKAVAVEVGKTMFEEGVEEVFSDLLSPLAESIYKGSDALKGKDGKSIYLDKDYWKNVGVSFLSGAVLGGVTGGGQEVITYKKIGPEGWSIMHNIQELTEKQGEYNKLLKSGKTNTEALEQLEIDASNNVRTGIIEKLDSFKENNPVKYNNLIKLLSGGKTTIQEWEENDKKVLGSSYAQNYAWSLDREVSSKLNVDYETRIIPDSAFDSAKAFESATGEKLTPSQRNNFDKNKVGTALVFGDKTYIKDSASDQLNSLYFHENISHRILDTNKDLRKSFVDAIKSTSEGAELYKNISKRIKEVYKTNSSETIVSETVARIIQDNAESTRLFASLDNANLNKFQKLLKKIFGEKVKGDIQKSNSAIANQINDQISKIIEERAKEAKRETTKILDSLRAIINTKSKKQMAFNIPTWQDKTIQQGDKSLSHREVFIDDWIKLYGKENYEQVGKKIVDAIDDICDFFDLMKDKYDFIKEFQNVVPYYDEATGKLVISARMTNGEYVFNFDFSSICEKRESLSKLLAMINDKKVELGATGFDKNKQIILRNLIEEAGLDTACSFCFVEGKRTHINRWANKLVDALNQAYKVNGVDVNSVPDIYEVANVKEGMDAISGFKTNDLEEIENRSAYTASIIESDMHTQIMETAQDILERYESVFKDKGAKASNTFLSKLSKAGENNEKRLSLIVDEMVKNYIKSGQPLYKFSKESLLDSRVLLYIKATNPRLFSIFTTIYGQANPKLTMPYAPYTGNILLDSVFDMQTIESISEIGGVRINSFSDFSIEKLIDYLQYHADLALKKWSAQAYTKNLAYAILFGQTGEKINLSLAPQVSKKAAEYYKKLGYDPKDFGGLDENGNYVLSKESVNFEDAVALQEKEGYKGNVGTILVGVSKYQILKALADDRIKMIIPYHSSGVSRHIRIAFDEQFFTDFTSSQLTGHLVYDAEKKRWVRNKLKEDPFLKVFYDAYHKYGGDSKMAAQAYLDYCKENNLIPRFALEWHHDLSFEENMELPNNYIPRHENYYKTLIDFTSDGGVDANGNRINVEQGAVNFDYLKGKTFLEYHRDTIEKELEAKKKKINDFARNAESVVEQFRDAINSDIGKPVTGDGIAKENKLTLDALREKTMVIVEDSQEKITNESDIKWSIDIDNNTNTNKEQYRKRQEAEKVFNSIKSHIESKFGDSFVLTFPKGKFNSVNKIFTDINTYKKDSTSAKYVAEIFLNANVEMRSKNGDYQKLGKLSSILSEAEVIILKDSVAKAISETTLSDVEINKRLEMALERSVTSLNEYKDRISYIRSIATKLVKVKNVIDESYELTEDTIARDGLYSFLSAFRGLKTSDTGYRVEGFKERISEVLNFYSETLPDGARFEEKYAGLPFDPVIRAKLQELYESLSDKYTINTVVKDANGNPIMERDANGKSTPKKVKKEVSGTMSTESARLANEAFNMLYNLAKKSVVKHIQDNKPMAYASRNEILGKTYATNKTKLAKLFRSYKRGTLPAYAVLRQIFGGAGIGKLLTTDYQKAQNDYTLYTGAYGNQIFNELKELGLQKDIESKKVKINEVELPLDQALFLYNTLSVDENYKNFDAYGCKYTDENGNVKLFANAGEAQKIKAELEEKLSENEKKYANFLLSFVNGNIKQDYIKWYENRYGKYNHRNEIGAINENSYWMMPRQQDFVSSMEKVVKTPAAIFKNSIARRKNSNELRIGSATSSIMSYVNQLGSELYYKPIYRQAIAVLNIKVDGESLNTLLKSRLDPQDLQYVMKTFDDMLGVKKNESRDFLSSLMSRFAVAKLSLNVGTMLKQFASIFTSNIRLRDSARGLLSRMFDGEAKKELNALTEELGGVKYRESSEAVIAANAGVVKGRSNFGRLIEKISKVGMRGISKVDLFTIQVGLHSLMHIAENQYNLKIGTRENIDWVKEHWYDFELTQINNGALSKNAIARGDYNGVIKAIFGFMQGANRAALGSQVEKIRLWNKYRNYDISNANNQLDELNSSIELLNEEIESYENPNEIPEATVNEYTLAKGKLERLKQEISEYDRFKLTGGNGIPLQMAAGLIAQGLLVSLINELIKRLLGKKDWKEWDIAETGGDLLRNIATGWIPIVNTITNLIKGYDISVPSVDFLNEIGDVIDATKSGDWKKMLRQFSIAVGDATGVPVATIFNYIKGVVYQFDVETAQRMDNLFYNSTYQGATKTMAHYREIGSDRGIRGMMNIIMDSFRVGGSEEINTELTRLYKSGYNAIPKATPEEYINSKDETVQVSGKQKEQFDDLYQLSRQSVERLIKSSSYASLDDEYKAKVIKKAYDIYHDYAKANVFGTTPTSKLSNLMYLSQGKIDLSVYLPYLTKLSLVEANKRYSRKEVALAYINRIKGMTKNERLLLSYLAGYSVSTQNKVALGNFLIRNGISKKDAKELLS